MSQALLWITAAIRKEEQLGIDDHALLLLHYSSRMPPLQRGSSSTKQCTPVQSIYHTCVYKTSQCLLYFFNANSTWKFFRSDALPKPFQCKKLQCMCSLVSATAPQGATPTWPRFFRQPSRTSSLRFLGYYSSPLPCDDTIGREKIQEELKCFAFKTSWA